MDDAHKRSKIVAIDYGRLTVFPPIREVDVGAIVRASFNGNDRLAHGYVLDVSVLGTEIAVSPQVGYGHGGPRGTPCTWVVGDELTFERAH